MDRSDRALRARHPRLISAFYFGFLALTATALINALLNAIGIEMLLPNSWLLPIAALVGAAFGGLFGEAIIHCPRPYQWRTFILGAGLAILALAVFDLAVLSAMERYHAEKFSGATLPSLLGVYAIIVFYSMTILAPILAIGSGFAAMYLRGRLIYDVLHTHYDSGKKVDYARKGKNNRAVRAHKISGH